MISKINIAQLGKTSHSWNQWIEALTAEEYELISGNPMAMELQTVFARPGEMVLLDGMLPNLSNFIERTRRRCPDAYIIVATANENAPAHCIKSERTCYISGAMSPREFVNIIQKIQELLKKHKHPCVSEKAAITWNKTAACDY